MRQLTQLSQKEVREIDLKNIKTCDLVEELKKREGVDVTIAEPHEDVTIPVSGPAIVLVITD